jgi:hypothetical protein
MRWLSSTCQHQQRWQQAQPLDQQHLRRRRHQQGRQRRAQWRYQHAWDSFCGACLAIKQHLPGLLSTLRTPATKIFSIRAQDLRHHANINVMRVPISNMSTADTQQLVDHITKQILEVSQGRVMACLQAFDGEFAGFKFGQHVMTCHQQVARAALQQASSMVEDLERRLDIRRNTPLDSQHPVLQTLKL